MAFPRSGLDGRARSEDLQTPPNPPPLKGWIDVDAVVILAEGRRHTGVCEPAFGVSILPSALLWSDNRE